jgi:hypothetical protein
MNPGGLSPPVRRPGAGARRRRGRRARPPSRPPGPAPSCRRRRGLPLGRATRGGAGQGATRSGGPPRPPGPGPVVKATRGGASRRGGAPGPRPAAPLTTTTRKESMTDPHAANGIVQAPAAAFALPPQAPQLPPTDVLPPQRSPTAPVGPALCWDRRGGSRRDGTVGTRTLRGALGSGRLQPPPSARARRHAGSADAQHGCPAYRPGRGREPRVPRRVHCRGPGPHVRGYFFVDALLAKT